MIARETKIVVPNPTIKLFLIDMFLKFMARFPPNFSRTGPMPAAGFSFAGYPAFLSAQGSSGGAAESRAGYSAGILLWVEGSMSAGAQTMSPYFPFLTSPATFPSTRVMTRLRMILTY